MRFNFSNEICNQFYILSLISVFLNKIYTTKIKNKHFNYNSNIFMINTRYPANEVNLE